MSTHQVSFVQSHYTPRASTYDTSNDSWHVDLANSFVQWLQHPPSAGSDRHIVPPTPAPSTSRSPSDFDLTGKKCLDLACGTGLVTLPLARAVGRAGTVTGVDVTPAMLDLARAKPVAGACAPITWLEADITALSGLTDVQNTDGGFDAITVCSALPLLPDPAAAIRHWSTLLNPGGRLLVDTPTEKTTLATIFHTLLRRRLGLPVDVDWLSWVRGPASLPDLVARAGLEVRAAWHTHSYLPVSVAGPGEAEETFERERQKYPDFRDGEIERVAGGKERVKREFVRLWEGSCEVDEAGRRGFVDGHWLYVCLGRRP